MSAHRAIVAVLVGSLVAVPAAADQVEELMVAVARLRAQVAALDGQIRQRDEALEGIRKQLQALGDDIGEIKDRSAPALSGPFLASPPASSDSAGIARAAVFAPRIDVDSPRRHDSLLLKVRRIEAGTIRPVSEVQIGSDQASTDLTIDQNGGLYIVEWSTSDGHDYNLVLRDGATNQPAATVHVRPLQSQGRFIFVGYRTE